jgi:hypothetical protein
LATAVPEEFCPAPQEASPNCDLELFQILTGAGKQVAF